MIFLDWGCLCFMFSEPFMRNFSPGNNENMYTIYTEAFMQYRVQGCTLSILKHTYFGLLVNFLYTSC